MHHARMTRFRFIIVALLWAGYALPLFAPPSAAPTPMPLDPSFLERVFPGVPGWWVVSRIACVLSAVLLTAGALRQPFAVLPGPPQTSASPRPSRQALRGAFAVAALHVFAGLWAAHFPRALQLLYIGALVLPAIVLAISQARVRMPWISAPDWATVAAVGLVLASWLPLAAWPAWRSPWIANAVDASMTFAGLAATVDPSFNLLTDEVRPTLTALHLVFQGAGILGPATIPLTMSWVQAVNVLWTLVTAAGVAVFATLSISRAAAPVAAAAFLFSPFVLMMPMFIALVVLPPLIIVALMLLAWAVESHGSAAALVAFGALAGVAMTHPVLVIPGLVVCGRLGWRTLGAYRRGGHDAELRRIPVMALAIALCSFAAALIPALPTATHLLHAAQTYSGGQQQWVGMEAVALGTVPPKQAEFHLTAARPGPLDIPIGALLTPIAFPRTPLRMLGDALFEPLGTALALLGLVASWRWRRHPWALVPPALLAVAVLLGVVSTYDRPSILRMSLMPLPISLLAAAGFEGLRKSAVGRLRSLATILVSLAIVAGGTVLYWTVTTRILPRAVLGIVLTAVTDDVLPRATLIVPGWGDPLDSELFAQQTRSTPLAVLRYTGRESLQVPGDGPAAELLFWSPGYEDEAAVSRAVCELWPAAELYTIYDEAGAGYVFAARPAGPGWRPAVAREQWRADTCGAPRDTEASRAEAALAVARDLAARGKGCEAVEGLRSAASKSFAHARLFTVLARALLECGPRPQDVAEAVGWATRASRSVKFDEAQGIEALDALAAAYAAQGRDNEAARVAAQARDLARLQADQRRQPGE